MSETIENRASVVKFRISLYFAQVTAIMKYSKITLKVTTAFDFFFRNRAKFENTAYRPPSNSEIGGKLHIFSGARGAPWVSKFSYPLIRKILILTSAYVRPPVQTLGEGEGSPKTTRPGEAECNLSCS